MNTITFISTLVLLLAAWLYLITGGADYGGGVWDLLASGPRKEKQRKLIAETLGPIWETNHIWLILIVVLLFTVFPKAFSHISIALHIPITLMLLGVIARGVGFVFRAYDSKNKTIQKRWGLLFSTASVITPLLLGVIAASLATGSIRFENNVLQTGFFQPWANSIFPLTIGLLTLALVSHASAIYLSLKAEQTDLQKDFIYRAWISQCVLVVVASLSLWVAQYESLAVLERLIHSKVGITIVMANALISLVILIILGKSIRLSTPRALLEFTRWCSGAQTFLVLLGWGVIQYPWIIFEDLAIKDAVAPENVQMAVLVTLAMGLPLLLLALHYLFDVFNSFGTSKKDS